MIGWGWGLDLCCQTGLGFKGSKGEMKVGGVKEISPNIIESTIGTLNPKPIQPFFEPPERVWFGARLSRWGRGFAGSGFG